MKKTFIIISIILIINMIFAGCSNSYNISEELKEAPEMKLEYTIDEKTTKVTVNHGTSSWKYSNGDGMFTNIESDSAHPLDSVKFIPLIEKTNELKELIISFSLTQDSYTVRRWTDNYIGNEDAYENYYENLELKGNTIVLPDDEQGYIYEVHATWPQGDAYYAFYVK